MERKSGVLMHVSCLFGGYSVGGFSIAAKYFIDFLVDSGFSYWQILPICMPDEYNSPYKSHSSFGANPYFIDLETLFQKGLLTKEELFAAREDSPYLCEYERLARERTNLLRRAAERIESKEPIADFCLTHKELEATANFMALKIKNGGKPFWKWRDNTPDENELFFWRFVQYEFYSEWEEIKKYANSRGIKIIGDLPMYVAHDSADVWSCPGEYQLGRNFMPVAVAGVPPDYFSSHGQIWHNPLYDWEKMKKNGFESWARRVSFAFSLFDGVRIDHFRALDEYFSIPFESQSAKNGSWKKGPGKELVDVIQRAAEGKLIIAEDLGNITGGVRELLDYSGFLGTRVLQFGFDESDSEHLPHNYERGVAAYTGTHDNATTLGFILESSEWVRRKIFEYMGICETDLKKAVERVAHVLLSSHAGLAILPIQDILGFGNDTRMNTPGTSENNWLYRITKEQLDAVDRNRWCYYNKLYGRK